MARAARRPPANERRQVNIRIDAPLYGVLQRLARQDGRSVPQMAQRLIEDGLRQRAGGHAGGDDVPSAQLAALAVSGGAFDWLADEPDLYDDASGEPA